MEEETMATSFAGRVVLVTGATSGIGETAVALFAEAGAQVFATARREDALEVARARHPRVHWVLVDVTSARAVQTAVEGVVREAGRLDVLVNNAATFTFGALDQSAEEMIRTQFETNVYGPIFVTQAALPALKESRGTVINISSAAGHKAAPGGSVYGASKAALESLTRSWALELAPLGIRVNAIAPGPTETSGFDKMGLSPDQVAAVKAVFVKQVPLGRMATTEDISRWIVSLADPTVTWITGQVFLVDGGMSLT
jgi:NAD(P)-dependent dehydrogenase (short-subunit alcohol dehydrogenase family)